VRPIHGLLASALTATLFLSGGEVFAQADRKAPKETASFAPLRSATPEEARSQAEAWLKAIGKTDDATRTAFAVVWQGDDSVLDKVAETLAIPKHGRCSPRHATPRRLPQRRCRRY
jgi:hypothetical protein